VNIVELARWLAQRPDKTLLIQFDGADYTAVLYKEHYTFNRVQVRASTLPDALATLAVMVAQAEASR